MTSENAPISKEDLESKFREIKTEVDRVVDDTKSKALPAAIVGGLLTLFLIFLLGKRIGSKRSAVVEIRRI